MEHSSWMGPLLVPKAKGSRSKCEQLDNHSRSCHPLADFSPSANGFYALLDFAGDPWSENKKWSRHCLSNKLCSLLLDAPRSTLCLHDACWASPWLIMVRHTQPFFFFYTGPNNKGTSSKSWQWPIMYCRVSSGGTHSWMEWDGGTLSPLSYAWCHVTALNLLVTATVLNCSCVLLIFHHLIYNCKNAAWLISACFFFPLRDKETAKKQFCFKVEGLTKWLYIAFTSKLILWETLSKPASVVTWIVLQGKVF